MKRSFTVMLCCIAFLTSSAQLTVMPTPYTGITGANYSAICGLSNNQIYSAAYGLGFIKYNGSSWIINSPLDSTSGVTCMDIKNFGGTIVGLAAGFGGKTWVYNQANDTWDYDTALYNCNMRGALVKGPNERWLCAEGGGDGLVFHDTGGGWHVEFDEWNTPLHGIFKDQNGDIWVVGNFHNGVFPGKLFKQGGWNGFTLITTFPNGPTEHGIACSNGHFLIGGQYELYDYDPAANSFIKIFNFPGSFSFGKGYEISPNDFILCSASMIISNQGGWHLESNYYQTYCCWGPPNDPLNIYFGSRNGDIIHLGMPAAIAEPDKVKINVVPNPAEDEIYITGIHASEISSVRLYDVAGQCVSRDFSISGNSTRIDLSQLNAGVYFIDIVMAGNCRTVKKIFKR